MSFIYKSDTTNEKIYFERGTFDRNLSLLVGLLAFIFLGLAIAVGYNPIGIMQSLFGFGMFGLAVIIFREHLLIPSFMIFDNQEKYFKLGNEKKQSKIPYSDIRKIDIGHEEHHERGSTNYYIYACLGQGGRWHIQSFGDNKEQAEAFHNELQTRLNLEPTPPSQTNIESPTINHIYNTDGSVLFKWHDKEHIRYSFLLLIFLPILALTNELIQDLPSSKRLIVTLFFLFVAAVTLLKIGLGLFTWHFVQLHPHELEYGTLFGRKKKKSKHIKYSAIKNFLLNYIPTSTMPAMRNKLCIVTQEFSYLAESPNLTTLRQALESSEGHGFDLINVESLRLTDRIDLYFFMKQYIEQHEK